MPYGLVSEVPNERGDGVRTRLPKGVGSLSWVAALRTSREVGMRRVLYFLGLKLVGLALLAAPASGR
jgi:hypothetical protein